MNEALIHRTRFYGTLYREKLYHLFPPGPGYRGSAGCGSYAVASQFRIIRVIRIKRPATLHLFSARNAASPLRGFRAHQKRCPGGKARFIPSCAAGSKGALRKIRRKRRRGSPGGRRSRSLSWGVPKLKGFAHCGRGAGAATFVTAPYRFKPIRSGRVRAGAANVNVPVCKNFPALIFPPSSP